MRNYTAKVAILVTSILLFSAPLRAQTGTLTPIPYWQILDNDGASVSGGCVWTYAAGTSTPITTYTDKALSVPNTNPVVADSSGDVVIYLTPTVSYKYVVEQACTPPAHGVTIRTQDNIDAIASSTQVTDVSGVAGEAFSAGQVAYLSDGTCGGCVAGHWYKASNNTAYSSIGVEMAMTPAAIGSGQTGTFRLLGRVTGLSSLTPGTVYYLGTAADLTTTWQGFKRHLGQADSATSLVLTDPAALFPSTRVLNNAVVVTITNTVTPTQILNYTVPAGTFGTYRAVRLTVTGTYANASGGNANLQIDASYGGQAFIGGAGGLFTFATGTTAGTFRLDCMISAHASNAGQDAQCSLSLIGSGVPANPRALNLWGYNAPLTVNSAVAQSLIVAITHSVASAAITFVMESTTVELVGQ